MSAMVRYTVASRRSPVQSSTTYPPSGRSANEIEAANMPRASGVAWTAAIPGDRPSTSELSRVVRRTSTSAGTVPVARSRATPNALTVSEVR